jgi:hypothetical protein
MLVCLDAGDVAGLFSHYGYIDARKYDPQDDPVRCIRLKIQLDRYSPTYTLHLSGGHRSCLID